MHAQIPYTFSAKHKRVDSLRRVPCEYLQEPSAVQLGELRCCCATDLAGQVCPTDQLRVICRQLMDDTFSLLVRNIHQAHSQRRWRSLRRAQRRLEVSAAHSRSVK